MSKRDTEYATELVTASYTFPDSEAAEARIERLFVKSRQEEEIRFSWWNDGRMMMRPLDLDEHSLIGLLKIALAKKVFSDEFVERLRIVLGSTRSTQT